jgi:hypothetical protein
MSQSRAGNPWRAAAPIVQSLAAWCESQSEKVRTQILAYQRDGPRRVFDLKPAMLKAILTDSQLWVPLAVLALGIALLIYLG